MRQAAIAAGVRVVTGDTKVVERGKGDGLYVNTSGVGLLLTPKPIMPQRVRPGDAVILSGDIGRHGIAVMSVFVIALNRSLWRPLFGLAERRLRLD